MVYILFDDSSRNNLLPLTFTKPIADLRVGIMTIREKWETYLKAKTYSLTEDYLSEKYPFNSSDETILINGSIIPNKELVKKIKRLGKNESIVNDKEEVIAQRIDTGDFGSAPSQNSENTISHLYEGDCLKLNYPWDIFTFNHQAIEMDFDMAVKQGHDQKLNSTNTIIGNGKLFVDKSAVVNGAILNTSTGPIFIGKNAEVMEGANIRGPFALCKGGVVKMGAKIYGATTIGTFSKVGGECNNVVIGNYTNKAHDGFLGNSVLGDWCNIGADTNSSNLKNTYDQVKAWNYPDQTFIPTGLQFCGLIMGDHSKCAINTMFNTGTVVGVNANIFGAGFQRNFIASFSWGGTAGFTHYDIDKAIEVAKQVFKRRNIEFNSVEEQILRHVYKLTKLNRRH
ncbi:MAG: GlmU family protein [Bacteroidales bacterium]|jgi:UDP-N-acetylglucosamine diphosphorylase/glucosamine-1-phosphate N-acetyltransferase|nr:GlmU family protein [Bacteroidales bacterium]MBP7873756.1 GlmU family protein [Bacteroidales bacterium]MCZ2283006.1 GlmU family protein [Bacteroidales bacterium]